MLEYSSVLATYWFLCFCHHLSNSRRVLQLWCLRAENGVDLVMGFFVEVARVCDASIGCPSYRYDAGVLPSLE